MAHHDGSARQRDPGPNSAPSGHAAAAGGIPAWRPQLPAPGDHPSFRLETVDKLVDLGGVKLLGQLIDLFVEAAPQRIGAICAASADGRDDAQMAAHTLKSSAGNLGAMRMWAICQNLETMASEGFFRSPYTEFTQLLTSEYASVVERLRRRLEDMRCHES